ncbi:TRADD-N-associated membrane domain-containing protein [Streptomyces erythrochromogenes]|uniref:TRADD-N-associated membrane domain-containing protein n=1 Tax=Streptomyces erythrochromogenes TaxID=285574 RepID=UPI00382317B0
MGDWLAWGAVAAAVVAAVLVVVVTERSLGGGFERKRNEERERLLAHLGTGTAGPVIAVPGPGKFEDVGGIRTVHPHPHPQAELGDRRDDFTPILVEYYAYGLTQARSSFGTSQRFAGAGAAILLLGIGLAVRKAEAGGELYLGIVTSATGLVTTLIGQLFHRRADIALQHMADQTAALRDDRRAAETTQQAIGLLETVDDPELRARLQAGLIMKLSGAELPR